MESVVTVQRHAVCIPAPVQGHINPMLRLAKLLHSKGFHITFAHTEFNYHRLLSFKGDDSFKGSKGFVFEKIVDGLPSTNKRSILDFPALSKLMPIHCLNSFRDLIIKLNKSEEVPPVSCIVSDGVMSFTLKVAQEFGIPGVVLFAPSACGMLGFLHFEELVERNYVPLKDESYLTNGYLDTEIDWIPAMKGIRLRDLPTYIRTTDPQDPIFNYTLESLKNCVEAKGVILNTFDELEQEVVDAIQTKYPQLYTIGPISLFHQHHTQIDTDPIESNLWKEDKGCLEWLDKRPPRSVAYVSFGSLITVTPEQLHEFAWGLANSKCPFLWVIRPDLLNTDLDHILSNNFKEEICDRGLLVDWCPQEKVLSHPSVGVFLTHCGWNSVLESITGGVPLICWPFCADEQTNCFYCCSKWGIGMEIDDNVKREKVEGLVREMMEGEKGKVARDKVLEWKKKAQAATRVNGSSYTNFERLLKLLRNESFATHQLSTEH